MFKFNSLKSLLLVIIQFVCIFLLFVFGSPLVLNILILFQILATFVGLWAIWEMKFRVNIFPDKNNSISIIKTGPYSLIRHPMYFSVLLITFIWMINNINLLSVSIWIVLLIDLLVKVNYEEDILEKELEGYEEYKKNSYAVVPYVY